MWPDGKNIFQYLALYNNQNFPESIHQQFAKVKISQSKMKIFQKVLNCAKSGHTDNIIYCFQKLIFKGDSG